jgi:hypothetical protein
MPAGALKLAVAAWLADIVRPHVPDPAQSPPHPSNVWPLEGAAVNVIVVPCGYVPLHAPLTALPAVIVQLIAGVSPD